MLGEICDLVLEENERRKKSGKKPLYVLYDHVYWMLTFGSTGHVHPVGVRPQMVEYTFYVDGISKAFAATGVRVGWTIGPKDVVQHMSNLLGHIGAWAPRAEQVATAAFLCMQEEVRKYAAAFKAGVYQRLDALHTGIVVLGNEGFPVKAIAPMGAIYLSVQFALIGKRSPTGDFLSTNEDIRQYLLKEADVALVPFQAFGSHEQHRVVQAICWRRICSGYPEDVWEIETGSCSADLTGQSKSLSTNGHE